MTKMPLYRRMAQLLEAMENCEKSGNTEWYKEHNRRLDALCKNKLPSGSGFDTGTKVALEQCKLGRLVLTTAFHHMDENGSYDGWTEHTIIVYADLAHEFKMKVTGENRNDIKDYIGEVFHNDLIIEVNEDGV